MGFLLVYQGYVGGNTQRGIRGYPYSLNGKTNPLTFGDLQQRSEGEHLPTARFLSLILTHSLIVHDIGEVWSAMLYQVYGELVAK